MNDPGIESRSLSDFTARARVLVIAGLAVVVATVSFGAGMLLLDMIRAITGLAYFGRPELSLRPAFIGLHLAQTPLGILAVIVPVLGGLLAGLMARYGTPQIRGHGIPEALEAILIGRSRMRIKTAILKPLASALVIGTGGPFGAEGPIIMTGGAIGSLIAQALPVTDRERKTLLVAGAVAGMTAVFGTPIAAVLLAVELLLFEWAPRSFIPVVVAAIVAELERASWHVPSPLFPVSGLMALTGRDLAGWLVVGLAGGLLAAGLTRLVYACEDGFQRLPVHWMWWPALGGIVVGIGGLIDPHALSVGYGNIARMLDGAVLPRGALTLLAVKAVIWAIALGSGTSGGVLAPLLIIGCAMGTALNGLLPAASPGLWGLLAMAATMSGAMRAPLTATFFAVELTGDGHMLVPLLTACASAYTVTVLLLKRSILTEKLARRGHHITCEYAIDPLAVTRVSDALSESVETVSPSATLDEAATLLKGPAREPNMPVADAAGRVYGIVNPATLAEWRRLGMAGHTTLGAALTRPPDVAYPDECLASVAERLSALGQSSLPVVSRDTGHLVGAIGWSDAMAVRTRLHAAEEERSAFLVRTRKRTRPDR